MLSVGLDTGFGFLYDASRLLNSPPQSTNGYSLVYTSLDAA